jgi:hypothetical protein
MIVIHSSLHSHRTLVAEIQSKFVVVVTDKIVGYARTGVKIGGMFRTMTAQRVWVGFTVPELRPIAPIVSPDKLALELVGERGFEPPTPWSRRLVSRRINTLAVFAWSGIR